MVDRQADRQADRTACECCCVAALFSEAVCSYMGGWRLHSRSPCHGSGSCGATKRRGPTGGRANGIARYCFTLFSVPLTCTYPPLTRPCFRDTTGPTAPGGDSVPQIRGLGISAERHRAAGRKAEVRQPGSALVFGRTHQNRTTQEPVPESPGPELTESTDAVVQQWVICT